MYDKCFIIKGKEVEKTGADKEEQPKEVDTIMAENEKLQTDLAIESKNAINYYFNAYMYVCMHVCMYVCMHACMYVMHVCIY